MSASGLNEALRRFVEDALQRIRDAGETPQIYRGRLASRDPRYDQRFASLPTFVTAVAELETVPAILAQYGPGVSERIALQFIYTFLGSLEKPAFNAGAFEGTVAALLTELSVPEWTYIGISNIQNFESTSGLLDLTDGITFRHRSSTELSPILGWGDREFERLYEDGARRIRIPRYAV